MNKRIGLWFIGLLLVSISQVGGAEMPAGIVRPAANSGPTQVSIWIWVVDISNVDSAQQTFSADVAVVLRWRDPRLARADGGVAHYGLDQVWHPRVGIANETSSVIHKLPESVEVEPDGMVLYRQRYAGPFSQALRLQSFPFDRQTFRLHFVAVRYSPGEVQFVPDQDLLGNGVKQASGIAPAITLPDWTVEKSNAGPLLYPLAPGLQLSGYAFEFTAARNIQHYLLKVMLPLVLIVMMSWCVFWTDPMNSNTQFSIAVTSMLTLIAYRFTIDTQLPRLPYMTRLDLFFLVSTLLVFFSLIEVLITTILENNQRKKQAQRIDRYCRIIFPAVFLAASTFIFAPGRS